MSINDENPHLIDTKMYLFLVECQVRGVVTELVVRKGNTRNKPPMVWKRRHAGHIIG